MKNKIKITLPFLPVSLNTAYSGYRVRHKSDKYKEFERKMLYFFNNYPESYRIIWNKFLKVTYILKIPLFTKNGKIRKIDVANYEKVLSDTLAHHIEGFEDEKIKILNMEKVDSEENITEIIIEEI